MYDPLDLYMYEALPHDGLLQTYGRQEYADLHLFRNTV